MSGLRIDPATSDDYPALLALNNDAVPHVNNIPLERLQHLHRNSSYLGVVRIADQVAGFLIALPETADYDSVNFGYFRRNFERFVYIDRIVVGAAHRRAGVGVALYADLQSNLPDACPLLTCEVNLRPPNPESLAFHRRLGFEPVGEQDTEGGSKRVCLLAKRLN